MTTGFVWHERCMWHDPGPVSGVSPAAGGMPAMGIEIEESQAIRSYVQTQAATLPAGGDH